MAEAPAYDASLTASAHEPLVAKGLTYPMGSYAPGYGDVFPIAEGVGWTRLPVPGSLRHINVWTLNDGKTASGDIAIVDTGIDIPDSRAAWSRALGDHRVSRVIVTHFHPDHIGCAGWLCDSHDAALWMSRTEFLLARMLLADVRDAPPRAAVTQMIAAGWNATQIETMIAGGWGKFARIVSPMPVGHVRVREGDVIRIGARDWTVWIGSGHTPEHVCLIDFDGKLMIAGDQVLPRITSNVSVSVTEPFGDPLGEWLASIDKFRALPDDLLVLPAHGEPFTGLHARLDRLEDGHRTSLDRLHERLTTAPRRAVDCFGALFARPIDDSIIGLATGEALAHLRHLEVTGRATRESRDGVDYYSAS